MTPTDCRVMVALAPWMVPVCVVLVPTVTVPKSILVGATKNAGGGDVAAAATVWVVVFGVPVVENVIVALKLLFAIVG